MLEKIKELCKAKGLSLRQLEQEAGIALNTITRWGENVPSVDKAKKVADALGVTLDELMREEGKDGTAD